MANSWQDRQSNERLTAPREASPLSRSYPCAPGTLDSIFLLFRRYQFFWIFEFNHTDRFFARRTRGSRLLHDSSGCWGKARLHMEYYLRRSAFWFNTRGSKRATFWDDSPGWSVRPESTSNRFVFTATHHLRSLHAFGGRGPAN